MATVEHAVWKTDLALADGVQIHQLPMGAKALHVGCQGENVCVWWLVDCGAVLEERQLLIVGTGHRWRTDWATDRVYLGTTQQSVFLWHVFEECVKPVGSLQQVPC